MTVGKVRNNKNVTEKVHEKRQILVVSDKYQHSRILIESGFWLQFEPCSKDCRAMSY